MPSENSSFAFDDLGVVLESMSVTLPTHNNITPDENHRFYESKATLIANEILESKLKGTVDEKWVDRWTESGDKFEV